MKLRIGQRIHFRRGAEVLHGYVTHLYDDEFKPARVRNNGRSFVPHRDDYVKESK